ncbi:17104_t:CDS:2 [Cetraspora pellucida]|uniref:17104_t:CDS:1 n=1 Tax=Cetraspora pellucida TaxID=1433469 RepID=A0A9N9HVR9_9GLOM|nr:17104_t:CDS:2 [Cetraspora pellucida]
MSSTFALASSLSHFETLETRAYDDDKYVPLLTFRQHSLDNQESENEDEDESTLETDTRDVRKKRPNVTKTLRTNKEDISKQLYIPNSNVSVDKMMIRFSGRSIHTIRIKNKPTPEGFKILSLLTGLNQTGSLVHHLVEQLPYRQFSFNIYMDNYFTSISLFQQLRQIGISACGTIRKTASGFLKELKIDKGIKLNWDVRSGVVINDTLAVLWQDNGPVTMLTTIYRLVGEEWEVERER